MRYAVVGRRCSLSLAAFLLGALPPALLADELPIQVNPNRPTFATPALTTQLGLAELELGVQHSVPRGDGGLSWSPFLLKLGLLQRIELRFGGNGVLRQTLPGAAAATGFGDMTVGLQWCYLRNGPAGMDLGVQLTGKLPTASAAKGLGSGEADWTVLLLFSRDLGAFHADLNLLSTWLGVPPAQGGGTDLQPAGTLSLSRTLSDQWSLTAEVYSIGATSQGPSVVSNLWALGYKVSGGLILDAGVDVGLSHGAQKLSIFAGLTTGLFRFRPAGVPAQP
jgi:hypothetical protein